MSPRRRKQEFAHYPTGLSKVKRKGKSIFRYRFTNQEEFVFPIGTSELDAIGAASEFNKQIRNPAINLLEAADKFNKPLSYWIPIVKKRVKSEEPINKDTLGNFNRDCDRLLDFGGDIYSKSINLEFVNDFLQCYASEKSYNVYNRFLIFLGKVFSYIIDESGMQHNYALDKKKKPKDKKKRQRIQLDALKRIHKHSEFYLQIAIELAMETTHASLEVTRIKYRDFKFWDKPSFEDGYKTYGVLRIKRQKNQKSEASNVEIPISEALNDIYQRSRSDRLVSPYLVHRLGRFPKKIGEGCDHPTQVSSKLLSREFSNKRDQLSEYSNLKDKKARPTFHEIRALSAKLFSDLGIDPQGRMAHSDAETTKIYTHNHVNYTRVPAGQIMAFYNCS
jgi:hypothetical protein